MKILNREKEVRLLQSLWEKDECAFVALYGRRRIGKTYLIRNLFKHKEFYMEVTGTKDGGLEDQLKNFMEGFSSCFTPGFELKAPKSWKEAFEIFTKKLSQIDMNKKITLFLDELPWLASPKSQLLQNLDYYYNRYWSNYNNLIIIVCGSAASWMLNKLINAKGGLHNRITTSILLKPFNLREVELYLHAKNINYTQHQILDLYMVMGGIPHYLNQVQRNKSVIQNVNDICFKEDGILYNEFNRLFSSLFTNAQIHVDIIKKLSLYPQGIDANEIANLTKKKFGGRLSEKLSQLQAAGFIRRYFPIGKKQRNSYYKIIDEYCLFYLNWIDVFVQRNESPGDSGFWSSQMGISRWTTWNGLAFERVCFKHILQIKKALDINNIAVEIGHWEHKFKKGSLEMGAQVDLVFDREDGIVNICEIKYSKKDYILNKSMATNIINKKKIFEKYYPTNKQVTVVFIISCEFKKSIWSQKLVDNVVTLENLFS